MNNPTIGKDLPKIICVDDDESVLRSLARVLSHHFQVITCTTGAEVVTLLQSHNDIAVILADLRLPDTNGIQLLQTAKKLSPNSIRAILSGQIDIRDMMTAVNQAEIDRFILKPWDNDYLEVQMLEALQTHLLLTEKSQLQHLAITDIVTGLKNHRYFQELLRREIERSKRHSRPLSLIMVDIDHFKKFNDQFGHPEGDKALAMVAQTLTYGLRTVDTVARYGGEEFAIVLPETELLAASEIAERLRKSVEAIQFSDPRKLTISLGATQLRDGENSESIVRRADEALYQSKGKGRNCATFVK